MPEIKHNFTGGKMNKDLDERIIPNGEYRHAVNVQVGTTDDSDVGVIQNILGNKEVFTPLGSHAVDIFDNSTTIGSISNPSEDAIYWFVKSASFKQKVELATQGPNSAKIGNNGNAILAEGTSYANDGNSFIESTWAHGTFPSGAILRYKDGEVKPVVLARNVVFKLWDSVLGVNHYEFAASSVTTTLYDPAQSSSITVGGDVANWIQNRDYPFTSNVGSVGFNNGWGFGDNSNVIEISNAREVKVGMKVRGWGVDQATGELKNYLPENTTIIRVDYSSWPWNNQLVQNANPATQPKKLAKIYLSTNVFNLLGAGVNNEYITHLEFVDNTLGFENLDYITGINIIDNNIFWTDGISVPKSINVEDGIIGSTNNNGNIIWYDNTKLVVDNLKHESLTEENLAVIKPAPKHAPIVNLMPVEILEYKFAKVDSIPIQIRNSTSNNSYFSTRALQLEERLNLNIELIDGSGGGPIYPVGTLLFASPNTIVPFGEEITDPTFIFEVVWDGGPAADGRLYQVIIRKTTLTSIADDVPFSIMEKKADPILEEDIGKFCIRYKYKNNQYSPLGPWSEPAFLPNKFDVTTEEGVNLGMKNRIRQITLSSLVPPNLRKDIVGLDILYKDSSSPSVFKVDYVDASSLNWNTSYQPANNNFFSYLKQNSNAFLDKITPSLVSNWSGQYSIKGKVKKSIIPELQTLRPWDNVPKKALAQEIVGNRIIYGNYTQGNDLIDIEGNKITTDLDVTTNTYKNSSDEIEFPYKSIKSFRNYQVGVVYADMYGRCTPVLTSQDSHTFVSYSEASDFNQIKVSLKSGIPSWADSYRFYIKGGEEEYHNLVQKEIYLSKEKETFIAFNSSDRNKITEEDTITLKVGGVTNYDIGKINSYKVLDIKNEAPESIKYTNIRRYYKNDSVVANELGFIAVNSHTIRIRRHTGEATTTTGAYALPADMNSGIAKCNFIRFTLKSISNPNDLYDYGLLKINNVESVVDNNEPWWELTLENPFPESQQDVISAKAHNPANIIIEMFEERKEDNIKFEGKFFVKIGADKDFALALGSYITSNEYGVTEQIPVYYYKKDYLNPEHSKYQNTEVSSETFGGSTVSFTRPFNNQQERWGQFLCYANLGANLTDYTMWTTTAGNGSSPYSMDGGSFALYPHLMGDGVTTIGDYDGQQILESVGRSLGTPYEGTWFIDDGEYVGRSFNNYLTNFTVQSKTPTHVPDIMGNTGPEYLTEGATSWNNVLAQAGQESGIDDSNNSVVISLGGMTTRYMRKSEIGSHNQVIKNSWVNSIREPLKEDGEFPIVASAISRFAPGTRLRWLEDPNGSIFTIQNVVKKLRINYTTYDGMGSITSNFGGTTNTVYDRFPAYFRNPQNFRWSFKLFLDRGFGSTDWTPVNSTPGSVLTNGTEVTVTIGSIVGAAVSNQPAGHSFLLSDAGENAYKLHPGMVLTNYPDSSTSVTASDIRIHSIVYSDADDDFVVRLIDKTGNLNPCNTISPTDQLIFKQYSMDGKSEAYASRGNNVTSNNDSYINIAVNDQSWLDYQTTNSVNHTKKAIGYTLQILKPIEDVVLQTSYSVSDYNIWETAPKNLPDVDLYTEISETYYTPNTPSVIENIIPIGANVNLVTPIINGNSVSTLDNNFVGDIEFNVSVDDLNTGVSSDSLPILTDNVYVSDIYGVFDPVATPYISYADNNKVVFTTPFVNDGLNKVRLNSQYTISGGQTKIKNVLGDKIELVNANNTKTANTPGLLKLRKNNQGAENQISDILKISFEDKVILLDVVEDVDDSNFVQVKISKYHVNLPLDLNYFNCYSFGNGVESVTIGDEFNKQRLLNNGRISSTIDWDFEEENIQNGLIYSGVYNPANGLNNLNQFIQADKITKDINPTYGSIQRLFSRDSDLIAFCEDKVLKILANKDALFNADGNTNLTASTNVLGQAIPFAGDYGISKNPESLASESYRLYFSDKQRGKILRLSMDGITPISDYGMNTWFKENLKTSDSILGSYDDNKDEYNVTIKNETGSHTISFSEKVKGWVSFKTFYPESGISLSNEYYTYNNGIPFIHHQKGTVNQPVDYNTFYNIYKESEVEVILNDGPSVVKSFNTLSYEGSQSKIDKFVDELYAEPWYPANITINQITNDVTLNTDYQDYNIEDKLGWYVSDISTDMDEGFINEFIEKEGKWFNYIKGKPLQINGLGGIILE